MPLTSEVLNRHNFSKWVYDLHNQVNKMLNKEIVYSYDQIRNRFENFRSRCNLSDNLSDSPPIPKLDEKGCVNPLYGVKSRVLINVVPCTVKRQAVQVDPRCNVRKTTPIS